MLKLYRNVGEQYTCGLLDVVLWMKSGDLPTCAHRARIPALSRNCKAVVSSNHYLLVTSQARPSVFVGTVMCASEEREQYPVMGCSFFVVQQVVILPVRSGVFIIAR